MKVDVFGVYRCRNCGQEFKEKELFPLSLKETSSLNDRVKISDKYYAFFHECSKYQAGYCEMVRYEVPEEELKREKLELEARLKDLGD